MGAVQSAAADGEALDAHGHVSEDVLHAGAHAAAHLVPQALALGERLVAPRLLHGLQADLHLTHGRMVVGRAVGAVGQVLLPGVAVLGQVGQGLAVVHVGWAHHEVVDQLAVAVHLHVVLVAEVVLAVLAAPARVDVLLPGLAGAPAAWGPALLDALVLIAAVALHGRLHHGGVNDLALVEQEPGGFDALNKGVEERVEDLGLAQLLAVVPDTLGVGYAVLELQPQELPEAEPVVDLVLRCIIAQVVDALKHQHLQEHHPVVGRAPSLARVVRRECLLHHGAERFPVDHAPKARQQIVERVELGQYVLLVEQALVRLVLMASN